jgi:alanine-alpha-ketoisovalerate/valine-pyruvate aminotransferase
MKKIIIIILLTLTICSCGTRKVQKSTETQKETTTETVKIDEVKTDNTKINIVENCDEVIIEPIDTIAPMIIDGKVYKNARLRRVNKKVSTNIVKDIKETRRAVKQAQKKASTEIDKKEIDKKTFCWLWLLLLIIPIYYLYRKYKNFIWFI